MSELIDNTFRIVYGDSQGVSGDDIDEIVIQSPAGACWLHLEALNATETHQDYAMNVAGQTVNIRVMADGSARLNDPLEVTKC